MHRWLAAWRSAGIPWRIPRGSSRAAAARIVSIGSAGFLPQDGRRRDVAAASMLEIDSPSPLRRSNPRRCEEYKCRVDGGVWIPRHAFSRIPLPIISMCRQQVRSMPSSRDDLSEKRSSSESDYDAFRAQRDRTFVVWHDDTIIKSPRGSSLEYFSSTRYKSRDFSFQL